MKMNLKGKVHLQRRRAFFDILRGTTVAFMHSDVEIALHAYFLPVP